MLDSYRALLGRQGARGLLLVCALSWLSYGGYGLALVLAVHQATGSYATAGAVVAVESVGAGLLAPARGRLVDRGGAATLRLLGGSHLLSGSVLTVALASAAVPVVFVAAASLGLTAPPLIAVARARWTEIGGERLARTGHAVNAALSDAGQIATPAMVAGGALALTPALAFECLVLGASFAAFALAAQVGAGGRSALTLASPSPGMLRKSAGLRVLAACDFATAGWLAGLELSVVALAGRRGVPELGALVLVATATGSIVASVLAGASRVPGSASARYRTGTLLAALALPLTLPAVSLWEIALVLMVAGVGFGLLNVALFEVLDHVAPPERTTEAFAWLTTASSLGSAIGAAVCGHLTRVGAAAPLLFVIASATVAALVAAIGTRALRA